MKRTARTYSTTGHPLEIVREIDGELWQRIEPILWQDQQEPGAR